MSTVQSPFSVAGMAGVVGTVAALAGIKVIESPLLRYDEMYVGRLGSQQGVIVGDAKYFLWRMEQLVENKLCRERARRVIEASATRILGEPWRIAPRQK